MTQYEWRVESFDDQRTPPKWTARTAWGGENMARGLWDSIVPHALYPHRLVCREVGVSIVVEEHTPEDAPCNSTTEFYHEKSEMKCTRPREHNKTDAWHSDGYVWWRGVIDGMEVQFVDPTN